MSVFRSYSGVEVDTGGFSSVWTLFHMNTTHSHTHRHTDTSNILMSHFTSPCLRQSNIKLRNNCSASSAHVHPFFSPCVHHDHIQSSSSVQKKSSRHFSLQTETTVFMLNVTVCLYSVFNSSKIKRAPLILIGVMNSVCLYYLCQCSFCVSAKTNEWMCLECRQTVDRRQTHSFICFK